MIIMTLTIITIYLINYFFTNILIIIDDKFIAKFYLLI